MHIFVLVLFTFWTAQPAAGGKPVQPESAHTATAIFFSEDACEKMGEATLSQVKQSKGVADAGFACMSITNKADRPA